MNRSNQAIGTLVSVLLIAGCSATNDIPPGTHIDPQVDGNELLNRYTTMRPREEYAELDGAHSIVKEEAIITGTQAGFYWAANEINRVLLSHSELLDLIEFSPLLIEGARYYIVPPVITEDEGTRLISESRRSIRMIDRSYYIEQQPKFALEPPTWRDYLLLSVSPPRRPAEALLGSDRHEIAIWEEGVQQGWEIGIEQAYLTHQNKVAQLTSDYRGMILYHILLTHNMVTEPQIEESYQSVAGGGRRLIIEESNVSIEVNPALNSNRYSWEVVPQLPDISHLFPERIYLNMRNGQ